MSSSIEDRIGRLGDQIRTAKGQVEFGRAAIEDYKELPKNIARKVATPDLLRRY